MKRNIYTTSFFLGIVALLFINSSSGREDNYAGANGDNGNCSGCHGGSGGGSISLTGAPSSYNSGETYTLTLTINDADAAVGGFQIVATNGTTNTQIGSFTASSGMRITGSNRLVHSTPRAFDNGSVSWTFDWTAPTDDMPNIVSFHFSGNAADGTGDTSDDETYTASANIALPISLISFSAKKVYKSAVSLAWEYHSTDDNTTFIVERGTKYDDFVEIERINTAKKGLVALSFLDKNPIKGAANYYRIKNIDAAGDVVYSKIINVLVEGENSLKVYPSMAQKSDFLTLSLGNSKTDNIEIYDIMGHIVKQISVSENTEMLKINLSELSLAKGRYIIKSQKTQETASFFVLQ